MAVVRSDGRRIRATAVASRIGPHRLGVILVVFVILPDLLDGSLLTRPAGRAGDLAIREDRSIPTQQDWNTNSKPARSAASKKRVLGFDGVSRRSSRYAHSRGSTREARRI